MWELSVPVDSERQDAISKLAAMAAPNAPPSSRRAVQLVASTRLAQMVDNQELPQTERQDAATLLGMLGTPPAVEALLRVVKDVAAQPGIRRAACEALGLLDPANTRDQEIEATLIDLMEQAALKKESKRETIEALLPLAQGASRASSLRAASQLSVWGRAAGLPVPMVTLTQGNGAVTTAIVKVKVWRLPLPEGQNLELVEIPGGTYQLGSPVSEAGHDDYGAFPECAGCDVEALRSVALAAFGLGRHPITHQQWAAVARLEPEGSEPELNPTPSAAMAQELWPRFAQPGSLPVDSVSWNDCQAWIRRLNRWLLGELGDTSPQLSLPSESCWEAACRAGTSTPFHWGDTIDSSWANYDGSYAYGEGVLGVFRQTPVAVGELGLVNPWGLAEMHGQLWEWCLDRWHPMPLGNPPDGRAWEDPDPNLRGNPKQEDRLARGGCWCSDPLQCRSASRGGIAPIFRDSFVGFRVACLPPDWGSKPDGESPAKPTKARRNAAGSTSRTKKSG